MGFQICRQPMQLWSKKCGQILMFGSRPYVLSLSSWSKPKVLSHRFQNPNFKNLHISVVFLSSCFLPRWCTHVKLDQVPVDQGRWCVCGNYQDSNGDERYAGGADGNQIRAQVRIAALKGWTVNGTDIRVAFLNAPKRDETRITAMEAPTVFKKLGLAGQDDVWIIQKAVYGKKPSQVSWNWEI